MNRQVGNVQLMQKMNRLKVLNYVRANPGVARPTIATETGLSLPSLTNVTTYLLSEGLLKEIGQEDVGRVGRKGMLLKLNERAFELLLVFIYDLPLSSNVGKLYQCVYRYYNIYLLIYN